MSRLSEPIAPDVTVAAVEPLHPAVPADEAALTELYLQYRGEIFAFLIPMTRDADVAEDVLQDTFIRLVREARAGRMPDNVRAWLYRVAANVAIPGAGGASPTVTSRSSCRACTRSRNGAP